MKEGADPTPESAEQAELALNDPASIRAFYDAALPRVYGYFLNRCGGDVAVAEDLTQETFVAAVRELKNQRAIEAPLPWVVGIARHKLLDHFRAKERERRRLMAVTSALKEEQLVEWGEDPQSRDRAITALDHVPGPQRAALVLRYIDGLSVPEVATAIGRSVHATESLLMRAKESFRRAYGEASDA